MIHCGPGGLMRGEATPLVIARFEGMVGVPPIGLGLAEPVCVAVAHSSPTHLGHVPYIQPAGAAADRRMVADQGVLKEHILNLGIRPDD